MMSQVVDPISSKRPLALGASRAANRAKACQFEAAAWSGPRRRSLELLGKAQSSDGGWGPYVNAPPEPFDTALALLALSRSADATDVVLDPGFQSGTITHVTGTGLIGFSDLASAAGVSDAPGLKISAVGGNKVKLDVNVLGLDASATAAIKQTGPDTFRVHIIATGGLPASLLGSLQNFTIRIPDLPMNLKIRNVRVTSKGVLIHVTGSNIKFSQ